MGQLVTHPQIPLLEQASASLAGSLGRHHSLQEILDPRNLGESVFIVDRCIAATKLKLSTRPKTRIRSWS